MNVVPLIEGPVLVTGAGGFIGRRLLLKLVTLGLDCVGFDLPGVSPPPGLPVRWVSGDICNAVDVGRAIAGVRTVFHLAAMVGDWGSEELHQRVTVRGSDTLFRAAVASQCRLVLASSIVVYGDRLGQILCKEETPFGKPQGPYSRAKQAQEKLAWDYHRTLGLRLSVVRPANVIGPASGPWVNAVIQELRRGSPALIGGGDFDAGLVYVDNLVDIMVAAAAEEYTGEIFNAVDQYGITWRRYFTDLARMAGCRAPRSIPRSLARLLANISDALWQKLKLSGRPPVTREALNLVGNPMQISAAKTQDKLGLSATVNYQQAMAAIELAWCEQQSLPHQDAVSG